MTKPQDPDHEPTSRALAPANWPDLVLQQIPNCRGLVTYAARAAGVDPRTVQRRAKNDPVFRKALEEAREAARQATIDELEQAAVDRALNGTQRPVYQGGIEVGRVLEHDNRLLIRVLETYDPERWRPADRHEVGGIGGGPITFRFDCSDRDDIEGEAIEDGDIEDEHALEQGDPQ